MLGCRFRKHVEPGARLGIAALALALALAGCSKDAVSPGTSSLHGQRALDSQARGVEPSSVVEMNSTTPPSGVTTVSFGGEQLLVWPYTGTSFDGAPQDPVNLIFVGRADPVRIRAALLALPEDHSGSPFPDVYPFNSRWTDATGDVQTAYAEGEGWIGNAIQLQLGRYEYGRVHLRLFRTGSAFGGGGVWTVGAAHFEILIPGTADHQVLSWDIAKQAVIKDLARTGLLDPAAPMQPTPAISQAPTFRNIPDFIYAGLPMELKMMVYGGNPPAGGSPGIPNDGSAMILNIASAAPVVPGTVTDAFTLEYNQAAPKPFCSTGPLDWVLLQGPVSVSKTVTVDATGALQYSSAISGRLAVTPVDITANPPAPSGGTFYANVSDVQSGWIHGAQAWVMAQVKRVGTATTGAEMLLSRLRVSTAGEDQYRLETRCLGPEAPITARTP
jgi:hypothetical protein